MNIDPFAGIDGEIETDFCRLSIDIRNRVNFRKRITLVTQSSVDGRCDINNFLSGKNIALFDRDQLINCLLADYRFSHDRVTFYFVLLPFSHRYRQINVFPVRRNGYLR